VAKVNVSYTDELDGGSTQTATGQASIDFTDDREAAEQSLNRAVYAEKELVLTAVAKDEAMQQADAGNYAVAAKILATQNATLNAASAAAPAGVQGRIRAETGYLNDFSDQLNNGSYSGGMRKAMQEQSYDARNSK
jgi:hypothetical protein